MQHCFLPSRGVEIVPVPQCVECLSQFQADRQAFGYLWKVQCVELWKQMQGSSGCWPIAFRSPVTLQEEHRMKEWGTMEPLHK